MRNNLSRLAGSITLLFAFSMSGLGASDSSIGPEIAQAHPACQITVQSEIAKHRLPPKETHSLHWTWRRLICHSVSLSLPTSTVESRMDRLPTEESTHRERPKVSDSDRDEARVQLYLNAAAEAFSAHGIHPQWDLPVAKAWLSAYSQGIDWGPALEPVNEGKQGPGWQRQVYEFGTGTYASSKVVWQGASKGTKEPWLYNIHRWQPVSRLASSVGSALRRGQTQGIDQDLSPRLFAKVQSTCLQNILGTSRRPTSFTYVIRWWNSNHASVRETFAGPRWNITDGLGLTHTGRWLINSVNRNHRQAVSCAPWTPPVNAFPGTFSVGDSVMVDAQPVLQQMGITVDAAVSRQFDTGVAILKQMIDNGTLPPRVVIGLGTNGPMTQDDFDSALALLSNEKRVVVLTVREPRWWEGQVNQVIWRGTKRFKNARVADWYSASAGHPEYFAGDGIHLDAAGALAYSHVVANALAGP